MASMAATAAERTSTRPRMKSLRDSLLEHIVVNLDLFSSLGSGDGGGGGERADIPDMPPSLFQDVLEKGRDVGWNVQPEFLMPFFRHRERLKWLDFSSFTRRVFLETWEIRLLCRSNPKPSRLSLQLQLRRMPDLDVFDSVATLADTLQDLELDVFLHSDYAMVYDTESAASRRPTLRLKRLAMNAGFSRIPLKTDPDALRMLDLSCSKLNRISAKAIGSFPNLTYLSLYEARLVDSSPEDLVDVLLTLRELKFLNLMLAAAVRGSGRRHRCLATDDRTLEKLVSSLSGLEAMAVHSVEFLPKGGEGGGEEVSTGPGRKLKKLFVRDGVDPFDLAWRLSTLAVEVVDASSGLRGVVAMCKTAFGSCQLDAMLVDFSESVRLREIRETSHRSTGELERDLLELARFESDHGWSLAVSVLNLESTPRRLSPAFLTKMAAIKRSHDPKNEVSCPLLDEHVRSLIAAGRGTASHVTAKLKNYVL